MKIHKTLQKRGPASKHTTNKIDSKQTISTSNSSVSMHFQSPFLRYAKRIIKLPSTSLLAPPQARENVFHKEWINQLIWWILKTSDFKLRVIHDKDCWGGNMDHNVVFKVITCGGNSSFEVKYSLR